MVTGAGGGGGWEHSRAILYDHGAELTHSLLPLWSPTWPDCWPNHKETRRDEPSPYGSAREQGTQAPKSRAPIWGQWAPPSVGRDFHLHLSSLPHTLALH